MTEHHNKYSMQYKVTLILWLCFSAMSLSLAKDTYSYVRFSSPVNGDKWLASRCGRFTLEQYRTKKEVPLYEQKNVFISQ